MKSNSLASAQRAFDNLLPDDGQDPIDGANACFCGNRDIYIHVSDARHADLADFSCVCGSCKRESRKRGDFQSALDAWNDLTSGD